MIERLLVLHNASNRTVELTAVGGLTGDAAPSGYPAHEAGAGCHLATYDVAVAVDHGGSGPERAAADAFISGVTVPPGRLVFVWVDAAWRSGPDCASAGASYSVVSSFVWVDYQLGVREGTVAFDHDPIVVVPHLQAWLDNAFRVTREGQPVSP